jgi:hypothetical protein
LGSAIADYYIDNTDDLIWVLVDRSWYNIIVLSLYMIVFVFRNKVKSNYSCLDHTRILQLQDVVLWQILLWSVRASLRLHLRIIRQFFFVIAGIAVRFADMSLDNYYSLLCIVAVIAANEWNISRVTSKVEIERSSCHNAQTHIYSDLMNIIYTQNL